MCSQIGAGIQARTPIGFVAIYKIVFAVSPDWKSLREFDSEALDERGDIDTRERTPGARDAPRLPLRVYSVALSIRDCDSM